MARVFVNDSTLTDIADAIREKNGSDDTYKPSQMADAVRGIQSGNVDYLKYATNFSNVFTGATFQQGTEVYLEIPNAVDISSTFNNVIGLKKVCITGKTEGIQVRGNYFLSQSSVSIAHTNELEEVVMRDYNTIKSCIQFFRDCKKLKKILGYVDFSASTNFSATFMNCNALEDIELKEKSISASIDFSSCSLLTDASIQNIIEALAIVETSQTLTFHADVKAKLTETQISQITSKNWTLA